MVNTKVNVLVVDDMEGMRRLLSNSLRQMGFEHIFTAVNGFEAWRVIHDQRIGLVLSDWNMPGQTGLDLLKLVRSHPETAKLPFIMMTAEADRKRVQTAIEAGVSEYIVKPFNVATLEAKIQRAFAHPQAAALTTKQVPAVLVPKRAAGLASPLKTVGTADTQGDTPRKPVLLVVDDVPDNLTLLIEILGTDYQVKAANSGVRALKILEQGKVPDLILLDVMMPEMDGFEVCRRIKADPRSSDVPVIFLSAMTESTDVTKGFALGAADYVSKPADPPILKARIDTHLKLQRGIAELKRNRIALIEQNAVLEDNLRLHSEMERMGQHDLKGAVAGIIGFSNSLMQDDRLASEHKDVVHYIEQSAYTVLNMVNLSLDLYKMEQGTYAYSPSDVDIATLLHVLMRELGFEWEQRRIGLLLTYASGPVEVLPPCMVRADELLCYSLFSNLLRNASEASTDDAELVLDVAPGADAVLVTIQNSGVVPDTLRATFFDKFSTSGKVGGTGLGTFSALLMARTQGGDIQMHTSDETASTTLTVRLPLATAPKD